VSQIQIDFVGPLEEAHLYHQQAGASPWQGGFLAKPINRQEPPPGKEVFLPSFPPYPLYLLPHGPNSFFIMAVAAMKPNEAQPSWDVNVCGIEVSSQEQVVEILEGIEFPDKVNYFFSI